MRLDDLDRKILNLLQKDAGQALDQIAAAVGSSKTPVWNRIRKLRAAGVIRSQVALLDPDKTGFPNCFFVLVKTSQHEAGWLAQFTAALARHPEIMEAHRLAGEIDYLLKVRVADAAGYDRFYRSLIKEVSIFSVTALLSMEELIYNTALPIAPAADERG